MNLYSARTWARCSPWLGCCVVAALACIWTPPLVGADAKPPLKDPKASPSNDPAEKAWQDLLSASQPPRIPEAWQNNAPSMEEQAKFYLPIATAAAGKARDFYTKYPGNGHAQEARDKEYDLLSITVSLGSTNNIERLVALDKEKLADPKMSPEAKLRVRIGQVQRTADLKRPQGMPAAYGELANGGIQLIKEFPDQEVPYQMVMMAAQGVDETRARELARIILDSKAPEGVKDEAKGMLKKMDAMGKPLSLDYIAVDNRHVNLSKLKGKVVLVDFWATWCGPCVAELPNVLKAYKEYHPKGFEIVGISFDSDQSKLTKFIKDKEMPWPQFFDGKGWENKYAKEFGITSIPAMWLVDKKGNLRDMNARGDLETKIKKYLDEKD